MLVLIGFFFGIALRSQFFFPGFSSFLFFFLEVIVVTTPLKSQLSITQFDDSVGDSRDEIAVVGDD